MPKKTQLRKQTKEPEKISVEQARRQRILEFKNLLIARTTRKYRTQKFQNHLKNPNSIPEEKILSRMDQIKAIEMEKTAIKRFQKARKTHRAITKNNKS